MLLHRIGAAIAVAATFAAASAASLGYLPKPLRPIDYLIAGSIATMAALAAACAVLMQRASKRRGAESSVPRV